MRRERVLSSFVFEEKGEKMPRGVPLTDDIKLDICELIEKGLPAKDIARQLHISVHSVSRVKQDFYGKENGMGMVIAGDKKHGTLTHESGKTYIGTCLVRGGRMKKRRFIAENSREAEAAWDAWKAACDAKTDNDIRTPIEVERPAPIPVKNETVEKNPVTITTTPIYILITDGIKADNMGTAAYSANIVGYFTSKSEADKVAEIANHFVVIALGKQPYKVIEVRPYYDTTLDLHAT